MKKTLHLLRMAHTFIFMAVLATLLSAVPASALAADEAYARLDGDTLTFYYNNEKAQTDYDVTATTGNPKWFAQRENINKVVFDASFKSYPPHLLLQMVLWNVQFEQHRRLGKPRHQRGY